MKRLLSMSFAILTAALSQTVFCQTSNSWGSLLYGGLTPKWPAALEAIHMCHIPPASGNQWGRVVMWGHGVTGTIPGSRSTQAYVWDTAPGHTINFIDHSGSETISPDGSMLSANVNFFCGGHMGMSTGDLMVIGGEIGDTEYGISDAQKFEYSTLAWSDLHNMHCARWYPTLTALSSCSIATTTL